MKLYEITNQALELMNNEEMTEEEFKESEKQLSLALQQKSKDIVGVYKNIDSDIEALNNEIKRLTEIKRIKENNKERFKEYVKSNMEILNLQKIETEIGSITLAKSPISIEIIDEEKIPSQYKKIVQTVSIDKKAIADNFKATGELIDGVAIHTDNTSVRIK